MFFCLVYKSFFQKKSGFRNSARMQGANTEKTRLLLHVPSAAAWGAMTSLVLMK